jgi:hypothetical protein
MAASTQKTAVNRRPLASAVDLPARNAEPKTQLGARISSAKYRQLKLAALLSGVTVQTLVEQAIEELLANHQELLPSLVPSRRSKSTPRRSR